MMGTWGTTKLKGGSALQITGGTSIPPDTKEGGIAMYVTYQDLIQMCILMATLVGLCYQVFGKKK